MPTQRHNDTLTISKIEAVHVLNALDTFDAELEQLESSEDWFVSDSRDRLESARQILHSILGIEEPTYEFDEESPEQHTAGLRFE